MEETVKIPAGTSELTGSLHRPNAGRNQLLPVIIICHGFVGSRIGVDRIFVQTARTLAEDGYIVLRFDYAGCGESQGNYGDQQLQDLIEQTVHVLHYVETIEGADRRNITLIGHSLGGAVATITASLDKRVNSLVLWSPVAYPFQDILRIVGKEAYQEAKEKRYTDHRGYLLSQQFFDSMVDFYPLKELQKFPGDVLIIHGDHDHIIPSKYCFYYEKAFLLRSQGKCDKDIIVGADHTYSNHVHRMQLFERTKKWLADRPKHLLAAR